MPFVTPWMMMPGVVFFCRLHTYDSAKQIEHVPPFKDVEKRPVTITTFYRSYGVDANVL